MYVDFFLFDPIWSGPIHVSGNQPLRRYDQYKENSNIPTQCVNVEYDHDSFRKLSQHLAWDET